IKEEKIVVLIYEDNVDMREGLSAFLFSAKDYVIAGTYGNCTDCEVHVASLHPHVILMDIEMPEINGLEGIKKIRAVDADVKIIVLTVFEDNQNIFNAICAGANGYLLKNSSPQQIIAAIDEAIAGGSPMTPSIASKVLK